MKRNLLIISGPTASGKTDLALKLAKGFNGELISADSRQIYKGMDVVTGKDLPVNSKLNKVSFCIDAEQSDTESVQEKDRSPMSRFSRLEDDMATGFYEINGIKLWGLDIVEPDEDFDVSHFISYAT